MILGSAAVAGWSVPPRGRADEGHAAAAAPDVQGLGAWEVYCSDDAALGQRRCHVEQDAILVAGVRRLDGTTLLDVETTGAPPHPGATLTYQVDGNPALARSREEEVTDTGVAIVEQMLRGRWLSVRYVAFEFSPGKLRPERVGQEAGADLAGFADAHAEMLRRLDAFGPPRATGERQAATGR